MSILASYHHSFAGGSKTSCRLLEAVTTCGVPVHAFFSEAPQYFSDRASTIKIKVINGSLISDVIDPQVLFQQQLTDTILQEFEKHPSEVLYASNLFPYGSAMLSAKEQILRAGLSEPRLILCPVGSDIWQIGFQLKHAVKGILEHPAVDTLVAYSQLFADEIKEQFDITRNFNVVGPSMEVDRFHPIDEPAVYRRKRELGIDENYRLLHHHSSMRRIKCPEIVLRIAELASQKIDTPCILIMSGTIPIDLLSSLRLDVEELTAESYPFKFQTKMNGLNVLWTGVVKHPESLLQLADVEINASLHDSFNVSLLEAMACGVPVVTSDVVGIAEHVVKSGGGHLFGTRRLNYHDLNRALDSDQPKASFFDLDEASDKVAGLLSDKVRAKAVGLRGASYVQKHFHPDVISREFLTLLQ